MRNRIILLFMLISSTAGAQQLKEFTSQMNKFPDEVLLFLTYSDELTPEETDMIEKFKHYWDSAFFNIDEKDKIMTIANQLLTKKLRPKPHFVNYINTVLQFKVSGHDPQSFTAWLNILEAYVNNKKTTAVSIDKAIVSTNNLIQFNALNIFPSGKWIPSVTKYKFENVNNRFMVNFGKIDITGYNIKDDSIKIKQTTGRLDLIDMIWYGQGGIVTWERAGIAANEVFAKLGTYRIDFTRTSYKADSVEFTNTKYFSKPVLGSFEDRVSHIPTPDKASFPQFDTYIKTFRIKNLYKNIDYCGGYSMQGQKFIGKGNAMEPASLSFINNDTVRIRARSNYFIFTPEKINGINTKLSIFMKGDSIYHGNVSFTFYIKNQELSVIPSTDYSARGPYQNSYHKMDMNFEQMIWRINEPNIYLTMTRASSIGKANFESYNYFDPQFFEMMMQMDEQHPLYALKKYADLNKFEEFSVSDYAGYIRHSPDQVRTQVAQLMVLGYLTFDQGSDMIKLLPKLFETVKASLGRIDYDVIKFESITQAPQANAVLNLRTLDLAISGIPSINVSNIQNVAIYPDSSKIVMKSNRSFWFSGRIDAGLLSFYGTNFYFNYDSFKIDLQKLDSIAFRVLLDSVDNYGKMVQKPLTSIIRMTSGYIYIDKPNNKSGLKNNPQFPIFVTTRPSFVYYDKADKAYSSNTFYFEVLPFTFDSLNTYNAKDLRLKGKFSSGGIFPDLEQTLTVQKDYSLGFNFEQPVTGLPAYDGKGKLDITLTLSNAGLHGRGSLDYLTSKTVSEDFKFYPDSMNTDAKSFDITKTPPKYPYVSVDTARIRWKPKQDKMLVKNLKDPFIVINDQTKLAGNLDLRPTGLKGNGTMDLTTAVMHSTDFNYGSEEINADTTDFNLLSLKSSGMTMKTTNVQAHIDYSKNIGEFKSNTGESFTEFPENQYVSFLDEFTWKMDKKEVDMRSKTTHPQTHELPDSLYKFPKEVTGAKFISVKKDQDSLSFIAPVAVYNYQSNVIASEKVSYIEVADALVFPDKGQVVVEEKARMRQMDNARIMANTSSKYHHFHTARVNIHSRMRYKATADYDFLDENNKVQVIHFNDMGVDTTDHSWATGMITEPDSFMLNPLFWYIGKVRLTAPEKNLYYDGAARIMVSCDTVPEAWVYFKEQLDPYHIMIPIGKTLRDINKRNLIAGSLLSIEPRVHTYSTFLNQRQDYSDEFIVTADGYLTFDKQDSSYKISSKEKLENYFLPGNYLKLRKDSCIQYGEGKVDLCVDLGQLKTKSVGRVTHDKPNDVMTLNIALCLTFMMYEPSMMKMAADIDTFAKDIPVDITKTWYEKKMKELMGTEKAKAMYDEIALFGKLKEIPDSLKSTIFLSDVNMYWNKKSKSYCSVGKIGVGNVQNRQINRYLEGALEVTRKRSGDYLDLYLKVNDNLWYYFGYTRGTMQVLSSDRTFTEPIQLMKPADRTMKTKRRFTPYTYLVSTTMKYDDFLYRFNSYSKKQEEMEGNPDQQEEQMEEGQQQEEGKKKEKKQEGDELIQDGNPQ